MKTKNEIRLAKEIVRRLMRDAERSVSSMKSEGMLQAIGSIGGGGRRRFGRGRSGRREEPFDRAFRYSRAIHAAAKNRARREGLLFWARQWLDEEIADINGEPITRRAFAAMTGKIHKDLSFPL